MFSKDFTLTKKHLGWLLLIGGIVAFIAIFSIDLVDSTREGGIGPAQRLALGLSLITAIIGLTLIPLGHRPA